jgi:hypothetical protein
MNREGENNYDPCSDLNTNLVVSCEGSIFFFTALTPAAGQWSSENVQPDAQWLGQALVVEHRYGAELAAAMRKALWQRSGGPRVCDLPSAGSQPGSNLLGRGPGSQFVQ